LERRQHRELTLLTPGCAALILRGGRAPGHETGGGEGLELHRVGARLGGEIDQRASESHVAVVVDAGLGDHEHAPGGRRGGHGGGPHRGRTRAGTPATVVPGSTALVTTAPAATIASRPTSTPGSTTAPTPMKAPSRMTTLPASNAPGPR